MNEHKAKTFLGWMKRRAVAIECECGREYYATLKEPQSVVFESMLTFDVPPCPNDLQTDHSNIEG